MYDDKSALEQMHCALLLQLMRKHGLGHLIATPTELAHMTSFGGCGDHCGDGEFRKLLVQTVLITDMSLHFDWMKTLGELAKELEADETAATAKENVKLLICQALIKCGDISNPVRAQEMTIRIRSNAQCLIHVDSSSRRFRTLVVRSIAGMVLPSHVGARVGTTRVRRRLRR